MALREPVIEQKELGKAIAHVRGLYGLTQRTVADRTGLTVNFLSLVENGERTPSVDTLNAIAEAVGVPAELIQFLGSPEKPRNASFAKLVSATRAAIEAALQADAESKK